MVDANEITKALHLWFAPGDVFEVRVLDAVTRDYRREHVESGYFDFEHIPAVPDALNALMSYRGVYVTVNPVNPDLLARAVNRIRPAGKNPTTTDADVICRRWLLIDCDAERPSGVSSSDKEHEAAVAKAEEVRAGLATLGWSEPLMMDSGNGAQLMYRIDLPTQDDSLVQKCVASIAAASSAEVKIDLTVHNAARIWRLPGTMNCKGDSIPSRPHRMAHILHAPEKLEIITQEQLQSIVISDENYSGNDGSSDGYIPSDFNIDQWISDHCPELGQAQPWKGGRRWIFPVCPFNDAHNNKSAVLIEQPSGAIAFKCHHNGCVGNDWQKLRELKEPGCYDRPQQDTSGVDLSGLLSPQSKPVDEVMEKKEESLFPNPGPLPDKLLSIPGFIDDVVNLSMATAPYPNKVLSFTGALAFLAFLVGRKVQQTWVRTQEILKANNPVKDPSKRTRRDIPLRGIIKCGHCGCPMMPSYAKKKGVTYYYYLCENHEKSTGLSECPVKKVPAGMVEQLVQEQLDKVFHSHDVLVELAARTQLPQRVISDIFRENFWTHVTPAEFTRMAQLILDKVTLFEDHIELDIKSSGMESIMEEFTENDA